MYISESSLRVRYGETDKMDFVYHGNYLIYYHYARNEFLREMGISEKEIEEQGVLMPVIEVKIKYSQPAFYDDILTIKTHLKKTSGIKLHFVCDIYNNNNELINKGETVLTFVDNKTRKAIRPPKNIIDVIIPFMS